MPRPSGNNLAIDTNEIMARSGGQPATLQLNPEGGQISMGMHGVHPTYAYGKILENGTIVSASSNVTAVTTTSTGFIVQISGGITDTDIAVASDAEPTSTGAPVIARCQRSGSDLHILTWNPLDSWDGRAPISFVIYRP